MRHWFLCGLLFEILSRSDARILFENGRWMSGKPSPGVMQNRKHFATLWITRHGLRNSTHRTITHAEPCGSAEVVNHVRMGRIGWSGFRNGWLVPPQQLQLCWGRLKPKRREDVRGVNRQADLTRQKCSSGWTGITTVNCRRTSYRNFCRTGSKVQTAMRTGR